MYDVEIAHNFHKIYEYLNSNKRKICIGTCGRLATPRVHFKFFILPFSIYVPILYEGIQIAKGLRRKGIIEEAKNQNVIQPFMQVQTKWFKKKNLIFGANPPDINILTRIDIFSFCHLIEIDSERFSLLSTKIKKSVT